MRRIAIFAIDSYKRYISPRKGFCCAYRVNTGRQSCSTLGLRAIRRYGTILGLALLRRRLYLCGVVVRRHQSPPHMRPHRSQRGDCDLGCDLPCDFNFNIPSGKSCSNIADFLSCCDCGSCDWPSRKKKDSSEEQYVYIPPNTGKGIRSTK